MDAQINLIDFSEMENCSKSHSAEELLAAVECGDEIWSFDSGSSGNDDILIYPLGTENEKIMADLEMFFEVGYYADPQTRSPFERDQPNGWSLEKLDFDEMVRRWPAE